MERDGEAVIIDAPQLLEQHLRLAAGVDEHQRGAVLLDQLVHFAQRMACRMPRPGQALGGIEHGHGRRRAAFRDDEIGGRHAAGRLGHEIAAQVGRLGDGRGEADRGRRRREAIEPRQAEREQVAALGRHQRMQFIEHDPPEGAEQIRRIRRREQQRELLGGGEEDVGRIAALPDALGGRGVAGARLDADRQAHLRDRLVEVAGDIDRQRLERGKIERVQPRGSQAQRPPGRRARPFAQLDQRRQEACERLAGAGGRDQKRGAAGAGLFQQRELMLARRPSAGGEPARERLGQRHDMQGAERTPWRPKQVSVDRPTDRLRMRRQLSPTADMSWHIPWAAMGHHQT